MVFVFLNFIFSFMYFRFLSPSVIHDPPQVLPAPESLHHFLHVGQATLQVLCSPFLSPDLPHVLFSCTANQVLFWSLYTTTPIVASRQCAPPLAHCLPPATPPRPSSAHQPQARQVLVSLELLLPLCVQLN